MLRTIILWAVRLILLAVFLDWFKIRYNGEVYNEPIGMVLLDIDTYQVRGCRFACSKEDIHDGDVVPILLKLVSEDDNAKKTDTEMDEG